MDALVTTVWRSAHRAVVRSVIASMLSWALLLGAASPAASAPVTDTAASARALVADLVAERFDDVEMRFDSTMRGVMPAAKAKALWASILAEVGRYKAIKSTRSDRTGGYGIEFLTCAFEKSDLTLKIAYDAAGKVAGLFVLPPEVPWTPPSYAAKDAVEQAVPIGPQKLPARLLLPKAAGPFPAVVLIHGSGPADEDETVAAVKVFRDLAYGLAAQGIASIRYPKRAALHPALFAASKPFTVKEEVTDDVQAALTSLSGTPGVDPKRLWLVGHSLGATLAPRIARENRLVSGIVILAGAVRPVEELLVEQMETIKSRDSAEFKAAQSTARAVRNPNLKPTDAVDVLGSKLPGSYFLDLRDYRPAEVAAALTIPILVLQGARDYQIPPSEFGLWKKRLRGRPRTALRLYPTLNHLFVAGSGPSTPAEYSKPAHVDGEAIKDIARFILSPPQAK
jgi:uncharacterized protein